MPCARFPPSWQSSPDASPCRYRPGRRGPGSRPRLPPRVMQQQSGIASGTASFLVSAAQPGFFSETDTGTYALNGQLGRGRYRFDLSFDPSNSGCEHPADVSRAVGAARMVRSDGVVLTGTVKAVERCEGVGGIPTTLTVDLTKGSRDLVGAHLTFRGTLSGIVVSGPESDRGVEAFTITGTSSATTQGRVLDARFARDSVRVRWRQLAGQCVDIVRGGHRADAEPERVLDRRLVGSGVRVRRRALVRERRSGVSRSRRDDHESLGDSIRSRLLGVHRSRARRSPSETPRTTATCTR